MGPEGGEGGGRIVAQGPPETIARCTASHTGQFLARYYDAADVAASLHLPPVVLPDLEKKPPKPKFVKPEKKTGVPTASKLKPESKSVKKKTSGRTKGSAK